METGRTVILLNLESLYESLYDVLNQVSLPGVNVQPVYILVCSTISTMEEIAMLTWGFRLTG